MTEHSPRAHCPRMILPLPVCQLHSVAGERDREPCHEGSPLAGQYPSKILGTNS